MKINKNWVTYILVLITSITLVSAGTIIVGKFSAEVPDEISDRMDAKVADANVDLDEYIGTKIIEQETQEYEQEIRNNFYRSVEYLANAGNYTKIKQATDYINSLNPSGIEEEQIFP